MARLLVAVTCFLIFIFPIHAQTLEEIAAFAERICSDIPEGQFSKETIEGKFKGDLPQLAKLLGASINADGSISVAGISYKGIPYDKLSANIPTLRECKLEVTRLLLEERARIARDVSNTTWKTEVASAEFHTTNDDKRDDSDVLVEIYTVQGSIVASGRTVREKFPDRTLHSMALSVRLSEVDPQHVTRGVVYFIHRGGDEWHVTYNIQLTLSNSGRRITRSCTMHDAVFKESVSTRECVMR